MAIYTIIFYVLLGIEFIILIPFSLKFRSLTKNEKWIYCYLLVSFVYAGVSLVMKFYKMNNMLFVTIMNLAQFYVLSMFYLNVIKNPAVHRAIKILLAITTLIFIIDLQFIEGTKAFNSIFTSFRTFVLIAYGTIFFIELQKDERLIERSIYINSVPDFWFNAGLFVYLCCSFIFTLSYNFIQKMDMPREQINAANGITVSLHYIAGICEIILFYIGFLKIKRARS